MARRSKVRRVYVKAKRGYRKRRRLLSGNLGNAAIGAAAGFVAPMVPNVLGGWTKPIVFGAAGYVFKKPALITVAGYLAGQSLAAGGLFGGGQSNGGMFE